VIAVILLIPGNLSVDHYRSSKLYGVILEEGLAMVNHLHTFLPISLFSSQHVVYIKGQKASAIVGFLMGNNGVMELQAGGCHTMARGYLKRHSLGWLDNNS
jgi:hypothetical protein